jgi:NAD(P)-dependent dehydrogenase (short-subunit alcohol dehydrogenase family)
MTEIDTSTVLQDVALIVGGGPGISSSCARLFAGEGMRVAVAARNADKPVLLALEKIHGVRRRVRPAIRRPWSRCFAASPATLVFRLVVHNIDGRVPGIFARGSQAEPNMAFDTM